MNTTDPILILFHSGMRNRFGLYAAEILQAEGFHSYQVARLEEATLDRLRPFELVILTEATLSAAQADILRAYVDQGGRLIAFRPDRTLCDLFGLLETGKRIAEGYVQVDTGTRAGAGISAEPLQFHGEADGYRPNGAGVLASLLHDKETTTEFPAVVSHGFGDGQAVAFTFNLPESIVLTRQGNPSWAGQERDGIVGIRAAEMFLGWADPDRNHLNQADEQMHLLAHIIEDLCDGQRVLPRLWYFPGFHSCVILLTDDGEEANESDFETHFTDVEVKGARMTLYLKGTGIPAQSVSRWTARGHEIASHFDDTAEAEHPTAEIMQAVARASVTSHQKAYGNRPRTIRNHWIVWVGWSEQAEIEASCGIGLDCNYYHYDQGSPHGHYLGEVGNFTGSGLPMKFANRGGQVLPIYQAVTQLPDEQWLEEGFYDQFKILLDRSLHQERYTFITINNHTDRWQRWSKKHVLQMLEDANQNQVPVWTAERTLDFLAARDAARFENIQWASQTLRFTFHAPRPEPGLTLWLPKWVNGLSLNTLEMDGQYLPWKEITIKGRPSVLAITGDGGTYEVLARYSASE